MTRALLADVGGTNVRFALADSATPEALETGSVRRYRVAAFPTFADAARQYLVDSGLDSTESDVVDRGYVAQGELPANPGARPTHAVFAFAGPVLGDEVRLTNHAWTVSLSDVQRGLGFERVHGINDFAAMAYSVSLLGAGDLQLIGEGTAPSIGAARNQTFVVMGPGTGLGVAALLVRDGVISALETEGGHTSFAPGTVEEQEILRRLSARFGRVSNERVLCGNGLVNIHLALSEIDGVEPEALKPEDITSRAADGSCPRCVRTVERFCEMLGAAAGDLVLAYGGWNGVYLAGGIAPLLIPWLQRGGFRRRFEDKGRFAKTLAGVPTVVITHPDPGLLGTAACAVIDSGVDLVAASA